ncbi:hypothetical protein QUF31_21605 [Dickeya chrysanthemi]|uniref:hypothetical protein n=1 Tax=Dickeya chrysanthemi TaxID=556 RepID=UPI0025A2E782|nr:hypothetical protein [Dickeya chrysanthemi]WJM85535.1 hypothetical protein QUF31_21605 [Dickeya chrysanthemi]
MGDCVDVSLITYRNICLFGVTSPLVINPFYSTDGSGTKPSFKEIVVNGLRTTGDVGLKGKGWILKGFEAQTPLDLVLANLATGNTAVTLAARRNSREPVRFRPHGRGTVRLLRGSGRPRTGFMKYCFHAAGGFSPTAESARA